MDCKLKVHAHPAKVITYMMVVITRLSGREHSDRHTHTACKCSLLSALG